MEALISGVFLVVATIIGLVLTPLEAQLQAAAAKPAADAGHDAHGHGHKTPAFPAFPRRGGCGIKKMSRSLQSRRRRGGYPARKIRFGDD